ncbi:hypothetical protein JOD67_006946 [Tenggerimyces flavus]|nr:hypothetical protein [Tenggerimyces flavus]MBM7790266.1 hypothetical protein [Tenggerimyces flavus]
MNAERDKNDAVGGHRGEPSTGRQLSVDDVASFGDRAVHGLAGTNVPDPVQEPGDMACDALLRHHNRTLPTGQPWQQQAEEHERQHNRRQDNDEKHRVKYRDTAQGRQDRERELASCAQQAGGQLPYGLDLTGQASHRRRIPASGSMSRGLQSRGDKSEDKVIAQRFDDGCESRQDHRRRAGGEKHHHEECRQPPQAQHRSPGEEPLLESQGEQFAGRERRQGFNGRPQGEVTKDLGVCTQPCKDETKSGDPFTPHQRVRSSARSSAAGENSVR